MERKCDFNQRRQHLSNLTDEELKARFWELARDIVKPLYELAYTHTSPSIERSVLLRMGFSSLEAQSIVSSAEKRDLLCKGVGNVVLTYAKSNGIDYLEAGKQLASDKGWDQVSGILRGEDTI